MGQESKTIQPTQEEIDSAVKSAEEQMRSFKKSEEKIKSEDEEAWRKLEEQMASPEGIEDIKIPDWAKGKEGLGPKELEKMQAFRTEFWKWEREHSLSIMGFEDEETTTYLSPDVKFENQNKFRIPLGFADFLVSNALDEASGEILRESENSLDDLEEIVFADILKSEGLLQLTLKSEDKKISLVFENKYPFKFKAGKIFQLGSD